jgi:hypothetical protein
MNRREILKKLGIGALSLTGIDRLTKVMANQATHVPIEPCVVIASTDEGYTPVMNCNGHVCPSGFSCTGTGVTCSVIHTCGANYNCGITGGGDPHFTCQSHTCTAVFTCDPQQGDFRCQSAFVGCGGSLGHFQCLGTDPNDAQFNCSLDFRGCGGVGRFRCDDFDCVSHYDCDPNETCVTPAPFNCAPRFSCPPPAGGYHS